MTKSDTVTSENLMTPSCLEQPLDHLDLQGSVQSAGSPQVVCQQDARPLHRQDGVACVLYQPEIPGNTGTLMRLAACWNAPLVLIGPLGFVWSDKHLKRASMDYAQYCKPNIHDSWWDYQNHWAKAPHRTIAVVPREGVSYRDFVFHPGDHLIMGSESCGLPRRIISECDHSIHIPMQPSARSMNLAIAGALVWAEGLFKTQNPCV